MLRAGIEPARPFRKPRILSPVRLPISPPEPSRRKSWKNTQNKHADSGDVYEFSISGACWRKSLLGSMANDANSGNFKSFVGSYSGSIVRAVIERSLFMDPHARFSSRNVSAFTACRSQDLALAPFFKRDSTRGHAGFFIRTRCLEDFWARRSRHDCLDCRH